jgi:hypothetical protein
MPAAASSLVRCRSPLPLITVDMRIASSGRSPRGLAATTVRFGATSRDGSPVSTLPDSTTDGFPLTGKLTVTVFNHSPGTQPAIQMANQLGMVLSRLDCQPRSRERLPHLDRTVRRAHSEWRTSAGGLAAVLPLAGEQRGEQIGSKQVR